MESIHIILVCWPGEWHSAKVARPGGGKRYVIFLYSAWQSEGQSHLGNQIGIYCCKYMESHAREYRLEMGGTMQHGLAPQWRCSCAPHATVEPSMTGKSHQLFLSPTNSPHGTLSFGALEDGRGRFQGGRGTAIES